MKTQDWYKIAGISLLVGGFIFGWVFRGMVGF